MPELTRFCSGRTKEKNRLHSASSCAELKSICNDIEVNIRHLDRRIEQLGNQAAKRVEQHRHLQVPVARIVSVKGIGRAEAGPTHSDAVLLSDTGAAPAACLRVAVACMVCFGPSAVSAKSVQS